MNFILFSDLFSPQIRYNSLIHTFMIHFISKKGGSNEDRQFRKRKQKICQNCK